MMRWVPRIASRRPGKVEGGPTCCELVQRCLAEDDGARRPQSLYDESIFLGTFGDGDTRMSGGRHACDVDNVLDGDRQSMEGAARLARCKLPVTSLGFDQRCLGLHSEKGVQLGIEGDRKSTRLNSSH